MQEVMTEKETEQLIEKAVSEITYNGDGPVTEFVAISRAMELASTGLKTFICANALSIVLSDIRQNGEIPSGE